MGTIRFVLRTEKPLKNGKAAIDLIYQLPPKGKKYYRTGINLLKYSWDHVQQRVVYLSRKEAKHLCPKIDFDLLPTAREVDEWNDELKSLCHSISEIEKRFAVNRLTYSVEAVLESLKQEKRGTVKQEFSSNVVFEFMDHYINEHKATREPGSLSVYKSVKRHLQDYCRHTGNKITFDNIDFAFFQSFQNFLVTGQGTTIVKDKKTKGDKIVPRQPLNNTTTAKALSTLKTFLGYAREHGYEVSDKYKTFKIRKQDLEVIALTNDEFETLYNLDLSDNLRLAQTRDVFCFSCATGLRYSDLNQLKREHLKDDEIILTVKKTKDLHRIPLSPYSKAILDKYTDQTRPLPMVSNQNMNLSVKELCKKAGIDEQIEIVRFIGAKRVSKTYPKYELIGVHNGRKTFATLSLEKGMSAEETMAIGGWKDYKSFKRYVKITEQRKKVVMLKAWSNPTDKTKHNLKAV
jgi:integrase